MKKVLTLIVMAVAFAIPSQAQVSFGIQGGLNLTNISDFSLTAEGVENAIQSKAGFFVGPTIKFTLPIVGLGIDAAALYDQREAKTNGETLKSQSIQVPINVRYGIGLGSMAEIFAFAGPQFGFAIGDKTKELVNDAAKWTLKSSNLSANVGLGATILSKLQLKVNYNIALGKTGEVEIKDGVTAPWKTITGAKANAWQVSASYYF
ncbi:MAG: porin family protein [Prevotella sp.]|nr:porin family protein [Prevotella sp.]